MIQGDNGRPNEPFGMPTPTPDELRQRFTNLQDTTSARAAQAVLSATNGGGDPQPAVPDLAQLMMLEMMARQTEHFQRMSEQRVEPRKDNEASLFKEFN